jgi:hypothetical protein
MGNASRQSRERRRSAEPDVEVAALEPCYIVSMIVQPFGMDKHDDMSRLRDHGGRQLPA